MTANQAVHSVRAMCRALDVSPSGFYAARNRSLSKRAVADAGLRAKIRLVHDESRGTYGMPRIHAELAADGVRVGRKRVARLMRLEKLEGVSRRRKTLTTVRDRDARPAPDLVERDFTAAAPDQLWVADVTYVPTCAGFLYLAVVLDVWSRRVVGWAMATHLRTELVLDALNLAVEQRRPTNVIHHSDQGVSVHVHCVWPPLPRGRHQAVDGLSRRCLRQRAVRVVLRHARVRAHRPPALRVASGGSDGCL
jgi:putative transposase